MGSWEPSWCAVCFLAGGVVENLVRCTWKVARRWHLEKDMGLHERPGFSVTRRARAGPKWKYPGPRGCRVTPGLPACSQRPEQARADCPHLAQAILPGAPLVLHAPLTSTDGTFPSRSFETNLNTYKRLAIKLPDDQIVKVGDAARCPKSRPVFPTDPASRAPGLRAHPVLAVSAAWTQCALRCLAEQL